MSPWVRQCPEVPHANEAAIFKEGSDDEDPASLQSVHMQDKV